MKIPAILFSIFLPWVAYDTNLFRRRDGFHASSDVELVLTDKEVRLRKAVQQFRFNVIPFHLRKPKLRVRSKASYYRVKSFDPRDSNQRKIRRKFNNA